MHDGGREEAQRSSGQEERSEQGERRASIGDGAAEPRAGGDPGEDGADDAGEGLERDADVGRHEPTGEDLEDEHAGRREEDEGAGGGGGHDGGVWQGGDRSPLGMITRIRRSAA